MHPTTRRVPGKRDGNMSATVKDMSAEARNMSATARDGRATLRDVSATARDVSATVRDMSSTARNLSATARDMSATPRDVSATARNLSATARDVSATARDMSATARDSGTEEVNLESLFGVFNFVGVGVVIIQTAAGSIVDHYDTVTGSSIANEMRRPFVIRPLFALGRCATDFSSEK